VCVCASKCVCDSASVSSFYDSIEHLKTKRRVQDA
jgi:hypothetical protein